MHARIIILAIVVAGLIPSLMCKAQSNTPVETFPASMATNDPFDYVLRPDGKYIRNPDLDRFWRLGVWKEMTNGWRVLLCVSTNVSDMSGVTVGSKVTNSGPGYLRSPYEKFAKFELLDSAGKIVQPKPNAGTNMLKWYTHNEVYQTNTHTWYNRGWSDQTNVPAWASPTNGSLVVDFPETASSKDYPHYGTSIVGDFDFSRGEPAPINLFTLGDLYSITNEGDYTLIVQAVLYKQFNHTNRDILDRVDLPSVTTKVHLVPNVK
jgi:hypothetical protein